MHPEVSVVIATYNCARFLPEAIESALAQTWTDREIVVVDDGSTDDTTEVMANYRHLPEVRYFRQPHRGHARTKNFGVAQSRGRWLAFLDADDIWLPEKLALQLELAQSSSWEPGVVFTRRLVVNAQGQAIDLPEIPPVRGQVLSELLLENFVCFSSAMVHREVWDAVGSFDDALVFPIDYQLWLRIAVGHTFDFVDQPLVKYRVSGTGMSQQIDRVERRRQIDLAMRRFLDHHGGRQAVSQEMLDAAEVRRSCRLALESRYESRWQALGWYLKALRRSPASRDIWYGLAALPMPEVVRRAFRRARRRPADWREPPLLDVDPQLQGDRGEDLTGTHASATLAK